MSPTSKHRGQPLAKPSMSMEQRRRRHTPADPLPAAAEAAELRDDGAADSAADAERPADGAAEAAEAAASAADGAVGDAECQWPAEESLALIGQELVPLDGNLDRGEKREKEPHGLTSDVAFQTPAEKKSIGTPSDQLQLQNTPWNGKNEDSENRSGKEEKMDSLPNGPPTSYGPIKFSPNAFVLSSTSGAAERSTQFDINAAFWT